MYILSKANLFCKMAQILPSVIFEANSVVEIKRKIEAYKILFDTEPNLYVSGYIQTTDKSSPVAFLQNSWEQIIKLGAVSIVRMEEGEFKFSISQQTEAKYKLALNNNFW